MRKLVLILSVLLISFSTIAQKELTITDAVTGRWSYLNPQMPNHVYWQNDNQYISFDNNIIWQHQVDKNNKIALLDSVMISNALATINKEFINFRPNGFQDANTIILQGRKNIATYNLSSNKINNFIEIPNGARSIDYCNTNQTVAYLKGNNLFIINGEKEIQVTNEAKQGVLCGDYVHRREFGISKGTFWSPSGKSIAFYRKDESMVKDYPLTNYMAHQAENTPIKYPMAGMASHQVTIGIYNLETGKTIYLQTGEPDEHYLTNISWGPNEEFIYVMELNREQNHMHLNQYRVSDGKKLNCLFEETHNTYVEPQHQLIFLNKTNEQFIYWSRKDGFFHLYLYNTKGEVIRQITKGNWEVIDVYGIDPNDKYVYINATKNSPIDNNIYRVEIKTGKIQRIDENDGVHKASFSPSFTYFVDEWSSSNIPGIMEIRKNTGKLTNTIAKGENTLANYKLGKNKIFTIKAADGKTDLYTRMILPSNFDPNKKYPAIIYVYGGPHAQLITNSWHNAANWWFYYMAEKGYIMLTIDNRGSANRGQEFEEIIHRQLGVEETKDQMEGIKYLETLGYIDMNRIGVHGWSYGGFMTTNLMLRHPETFKVGVAGGPVVDWKMYEVMYGERYMDTPQENPKGYKEANMLNYVNSLKGKLLYIHGMQDDVVVPQHSMKFLRECVRQDKAVDFFCYPTHQHNVNGKDRVHLMKKISQYFFDYL